jgi:O-succinylbenzoic acid--CoA ligase
VIVHELIALDLPGGPRFVDELERAWTAGNAVLPIDQRLPRPLRDELIARMGAGVVVDATDTARTGHGRPVEPGDAAVVATSGSTGIPKGVVLTHDAVAASAAATSQRLRVTDRDHWLACLPLSHVGGLSVVFRALLGGTALTVHPGFEPAAVEASGATLVSLVATAMRRIDPTIFRTIVLGGARPPADRPPNTVTTYGMTETGSGVVYDRVPLDGVEVRIVDGEVQLRGAMLLRCYRDGTDPKHADGWFPTGDLGAVDDVGRLTVLGRRGDLIITGGENVWPDPVEAVLRRHPDVEDVAIHGVADPEWGQVVVAVVVPRDPTEPPSLEQLRDHVKMELPAFNAPRRVTFVAELPRTTLGKVERSRLPRLDR